MFRSRVAFFTVAVYTHLYIQQTYFSSITDRGKRRVR
jgi:hypothetical protein